MAIVSYPSSGQAERIDPDILLAETRMAGFAMVNSYLRQYRILADYLQMKPASALVFLTILVAASQRFVRRTPIQDEFRGVAPLPPEDLIPISRRALASATGLPRETVRRIVAELIASGDVIEVGRKGVINRFGELLRPGAQHAVKLLAAEYAQTFEALSRLGVLEQ